VSKDLSGLMISPLTAKLLEPLFFFIMSRFAKSLRLVMILLALTKSHITLRLNRYLLFTKIND